MPSLIPQYSVLFFTASNLALSSHLRLDEKCNAESFDRTHVTEFKRTSQKLEIPAAVFHCQTEITGATVESPEAAGSGAIINYHLTLVSGVKVSCLGRDSPRVENKSTVQQNPVYGSAVWSSRKLNQ